MEKNMKKIEIGEREEGCVLDGEGRELERDEKR